MPCTGTGISGPQGPRRLGHNAAQAYYHVLVRPAPPQPLCGPERQVFSQLNSVAHSKCRTVFRLGLAPVVEPRGGHIRVAKPFLDLGDIRLVVDSVRGGRRAQ